MGGQLHHRTMQCKRAHEKKSHRDLKMPKSSTRGLGPGQERRSRIGGIEELHGRGVINGSAVASDQRARTKKVMGETGIGDYIARDRFRFIFEVENTSLRTVHGKEATIGQGKRKGGQDLRLK